MTGQHTIEIGEVRCSIDFENGFFQDMFNLVLTDYKRWGFYKKGEAKISIVVREGLLPPPPKLSNTIFYQALDYDSIHASLLFDTERLKGQIGFIMKWHDKFTIVRISEIIQTFICNSYIFYFFLNGLGTFIHSCGISDDKGGYIFAGQSEAGKSTIARLSLPRTVLCDELILLRKNRDGKKQIFGTPFGGEFEGINKSTDCKAIYFIEKSNINEITPISRMTAVVTLIKEGITGGFMSTDSIHRICPTSKYLSILTDLLDGIPCYKMKFIKDSSFWELIDGR